MGNMIKAIIFDMDGLLIDSEPVWFRARHELLQTINMEWKWENQKNTMGVSTNAWVEYIHKFVEGKLSEEEILKGVTERVKQIYSSGEVKLMQGALQALKYASDNFKVGLASGSYKEILHSVVKVNNWGEYFDEILSSDDMERGKPNPDIYLEVAKRLSVKPEECIVLEDSRDGIKAGVAAGAKIITVPSKDVTVPQEVLDSAFAILDSLNDFPQIVDELIYN